MSNVIQIAELKVSDTRAHIVSRQNIPKGLIGGYIKVTFVDALWSNLEKTAVFRSDVTKDVVVQSSEVPVPVEVLQSDGMNLSVGFYGVDSDDIVAIPTIWATLGGIKDAAEPSGDITTDPTLPIWAQLKAMIGDLAQLDTEAKESLVAAINELAARSGGEADPEAVREIVAEYLAENPPAPGQDGQDGASAYEIAKANGFEGSEMEWLESLEGKPGEPGSDGITPHIGDNGNWFLGDTDTGKPSRGGDGKDGKDGTNGADGYTPVRGVDYWTDADQTTIVNAVLANFTNVAEVGA